MKTDEVARKIEALTASTLEAVEVEGLRAALGGCAGTHNPHVFGDPVLREAWAWGLRQMHAVFPTGVGMARRWSRGTRASTGVPHRPGDGPANNSVTGVWVTVAAVNGALALAALYG